MQDVNITQSYLETLSSTELNQLADEFGIDIPDNLSRSFMIAELIQIAEELNKLEKSDLTEVESDDYPKTLPLSYNENKITAVLQNPAWCYTYWDFNEEEYIRITTSHDFKNFFLRISYFAQTDYLKPSDYHDIPVHLGDRDYYILLGKSAQAAIISLMVQYENKAPVSLSKSNIIFLAWIYPEIDFSWIHKKFPPLLTLSGLPEILKKHYNEHRHSFSRDK